MNRDTDVSDYDIAKLAVNKATARALNIHRSRLDALIANVQDDLSEALQSIASKCTAAEMRQLAMYIRKKCLDGGIPLSEVVPYLIAHVILSSQQAKTCLSFALELAPELSARQRSFEILWQLLSIELGYMEREIQDYAPSFHELNSKFGEERLEFYREVYCLSGLAASRQLNRNIRAVEIRYHVLVAFLELHDETEKDRDPESILFSANYRARFRELVENRLTGDGHSLRIWRYLLRNNPQGMLEYSNDLMGDLQGIFLQSDILPTAL